jgi:hypothetical protein
LRTRPENLDLGAPIFCVSFDLETALLRENAARMAREDSGCTLDEEEIEDALPQSASSRVHQPPTAPVGTTPLTGKKKKKDQQ